MLNWLFGKRLVSRPQVWILRSLSFDLDAVDDVVKRLEEATGQPATLTVHGPMTNEDLGRSDRVVTRAELPKLAPHELLRLTALSEEVHVDLREATEPCVIYNGDDLEVKQSVDRLVEYMTSVGTPRVRWEIIDSAPAALAAGLALAGGVGAIITWPFPELPQNIVLTLIVVVLSALLWREVTNYRKARRTFTRLYRGHRVQPFSRAQVLSDRAQSRRDWKVGIVVGPLGALLGSIATLFIVASLR